jgi:hypothetical protein
MEPTLPVPLRSDAGPATVTTPLCDPAAGEGATPDPIPLAPIRVVRVNAIHSGELRPLPYAADGE